MSTNERDFPPPLPPDHVGMPGRVAAGILALQSLGCVLAVYFATRASQDASLDGTSQLMFSLFTLLFAVGLGLMARGLWKGRRWPRTAALVWLALLLPVGWAIVQADRALVGVLILSTAVLGMAAVGAESKAAATG